MSGTHDGHRKRLREQFVKGGIDALSEYQALELLLFYSSPRGDVNPLAHRLKDAFGSVAGVLDAPYSELLKIDGVGEGTATFLKMLPQLMRLYELSRDRREHMKITDVHSAGKYILPYYTDKTQETVFIHCIDAKGKVLGSRLMCSGNINSASVSPRKIVEAALSLNASGVLLSHNHTSGVALPSAEDIETTARISEALKAVDIVLVDHIIVADGDFVSLSDCGYI
ncbi:MAG: DNA repair protein RadC [Oscillospiraceae bacterium]|nr:DNA repair protein RadC [Oscillospiraceae bacterium]